MTEEEKRIYNKKYRETHKEEIKLANKKYRKNNREKELARHKEYNKTHKEQMKIYNAGRNNDLRQKAILFLGGKCCLCGSEDNLQFHHINGFIINDVNEHRNKYKMWKRILSGNANDILLLCYKCHKKNHNWNDYTEKFTENMTKGEKKKIYNKKESVINIKKAYSQTEKAKKLKREWTKKYQSTDEYKEKHRLSQQRYIQRKREKENNNVI